MRIVFVAVMAVLACACGIDTSRYLSPEVADGSDVEAWTAEVQSAIDGWQDAVGGDCQLPISIGTGGAPIVLMPGLWQRGLTTTGYNQRDVRRIDIRAGMDPRATRGVIMHELGHAIGLAHDWSADSIMHTPSSATAPSDGDAKRARDALGC